MLARAWRRDAAARIPQIAENKIQVAMFRFAKVDENWSCGGKEEPGSDDANYSNFFFFFFFFYQFVGNDRASWN